MGAKFGVVLSGCGVFDGAEIHESVLTLLAIQRQGGEYQCFAPNVEQHHVLNHISGEEVEEKRNVLVESARIARGDIKDLKDFQKDDYDALIFPGGFGVAKNLCDFAFEAEGCEVNPEVERAIKVMVESNKPVGALCISPVILANVLGNVEVTIGSDEETAGSIEAMGAAHKKATHGEVVKDSQRKVFSTPCYMLEANISQIADGADNIVKAMMESL